MAYLGLDLSGTTGWAVKGPDDRPPVTGTYRFPDTGTDHAAYFLPFYDFLEALTIEHGITVWCYETLFAGDMKDPVALCRHFGGPVLVEVWARQLGLCCKEVPVSTWRKRFFGVGQAPRKMSQYRRQKWLKAKAIEECRARGWQVENDHEAEACGILNYWLCHDFPEYAAADGPLFRGAAA